MGMEGLVYWGCDALFIMDVCFSSLSILNKVFWWGFIDV
jgi:hypothetical protein